MLGGMSGRPKVLTVVKDVGVDATALGLAGQVPHLREGSALRGYDDNDDELIHRE